MNLTSLSDVKKLLDKHRFPIRKKYGQNFLIDQNVLQKILVASDLSKEKNVLEIGPGLGTMTCALAQEAKYVKAVEIDDFLIPILEEQLNKFDNITLIHGDALKLDWSMLFQPEEMVTIVANLPYYITSPLIEKMVEAPFFVEKAVIMVQKEVADRLTALPGSSLYGSLSVYLQSHAQVELVASVSRQVFHPKPKVDSAIVALSFDLALKEKIKDPVIMEKLLRSVFGQRRKTLRNGLLNSPYLALDREKIEQIEAFVDYPMQIRAENLTPEQFVELSNFVAGLFELP